MSANWTLPLHWEHIPARPADRQYRVGDAADNFVRDFASEVAARAFVREINAEHLKSIETANWRF